jgi:hypothetical protein
MSIGQITWPQETFLNSGQLERANENPVIAVKINIDLFHVTDNNHV